MAGTAQKILDLIEDIAGADPARRVGAACAGRKVSLGGTALRADAHPFRQVLDAETMVQLSVEIGKRHYSRRRVLFPDVGDSDYLRQRRERAALIRSLVGDGNNVRATARAAKVHRRTVTYHRARMRAEGLLPGASAHV